MEIRRLTAADAPAFRALRLAALRRHPADFGSDFSREAERGVGHFVGQLLDNHVIGAVGEELLGIMCVEFRTPAKVAHRAFLWGVYVRPAGRGVAPALLDAALGVAFGRSGVSQVELGVRVGNAAAERLYGSRGFARYGVEPATHLVDGVAYDDALMVLRRRDWRGGAGA